MVLMEGSQIVQLSLISVLASINLIRRTGLGGLLNPSGESFVSLTHLSLVRPWAHGAICEHAEFPFLSESAWLFLASNLYVRVVFPNGSKHRAVLQLSLEFSLGERNI